MSGTLYDECASGNVEEAQQMILNGADVNMTSDKDCFNKGTTPLYIASCNGRLEIVKVLIASGALLDKANNDGETPLINAIMNGYLEIVKVLIASGALLDKANNNGWTPLYSASWNGQLEIVKVLIANKANFFYMNNEGKTPLDVARTNAIRQCIINHPWYRRRPLLLTRPHDDHETNEEHDVTSLGAIITAKGIADASSEDSVLYQLKMKVALFL